MHDGVRVKKVPGKRSTGSKGKATKGKATKGKSPKALSPKAKSPIQESTFQWVKTKMVSALSFLFKTGVFITELLKPLVKKVLETCTSDLKTAGICYASIYQRQK